MILTKATHYSNKCDNPFFVYLLQARSLLLAEKWTIYLKILVAGQVLVDV